MQERQTRPQPPRDRRGPHGERFYQSLSTYLDGAVRSKLGAMSGAGVLVYACGAAAMTLLITLALLFSTLSVEGVKVPAFQPSAQQAHSLAEGAAPADAPAVDSHA